MVDNWLQSQLELLETGLEEAAKEGSVATVSVASRSETPEASRP